MTDVGFSSVSNGGRVQNVVHVDGTRKLGLVEKYDRRLMEYES